MAIHRQSLGYITGAQTYAAGRPGYPPEAGDWLRETLGIGPGSRVLEVGAGTGKFLPLLKACTPQVIALEPIAEMRAILQRDHPDVEALAGTADAIPLPGAAVDAIVCAQAFHWFATAAAVAEMRRVLKPGGTLGLIWNVRDESVPWVAALTAITNRYESDAPRYRSGLWRHAFPAPGFAFLGERHVRHSHIGPPEQVIVGRTLSVSFIANLPEPQRREAEQAVRSLIADTPELAGKAEIAFPYETDMYAWRAV